MTNSPGVPEPSSARRPPATRARLLLVVPMLVGLALAVCVARRAFRSESENPEQLLQQAHAAWSSGRREDAEAILAALSSRYRPKSVPERLLRAQIAKEGGRLEQAFSELEGVRDSDPGAAVIWQARGMLEFERDHAGGAEAALLHALALDPKLVEARRGLVDLYAILARKNNLGAELRALARTSVLTFDDLYLGCLGRRPNVTPAELAAKLKQMLPNEPAGSALERMIRLSLAENERRLGRLAEAESVLAPLSALDPDARAVRARLAIDRGAVDVAERLLSDGPAGHPGLERLRGRLALGRGDARAADHFRAALAVEPDDRDALFGLGQSLRAAGQAAQAAQFLEAAAARDHLEWLIQNARSSFEREDPKVLSALGDASLALGRLPEAQGWYRLALARDPLAAAVQKRLFDLDAKLAIDPGGGNPKKRPE